MFFVVHVATGILGLRIASMADAVTLFWAPTGLSIAAVLLLGRRAVVAAAVGAFCISYASTRSVPFSVISALANGTEARIVAGTFSRWAQGRTDLGRGGDAGAYALAAALGCAAAALLGAVGVVLFVSDGDVPLSSAFTMWWLGDMVGALLVGPAILTLASPLPGQSRRRTNAWSGGVVVMTVIATVALHTLEAPDRALAAPLAFAQLVAIVAASLRFGTRGAHLTALAITIAAVLGAVHGRGPYSSGAAHIAFDALWAALATVAGTALFVSSLIAERTSAKRRLMASEERLRALFENAADGMLLIDAERNVVLANPSALRMVSLGDDADPEAWHRLSGGDVLALRDTIREGMARGERLVETRMKYGADTDSPRDIVVRASILGTPPRFDGAVVLVTDVTAHERAERDREMIEQRLASAQRLDSIGTLAGGIAHDFNNMLQAIRANVEMAKLMFQKHKDPELALTRALGAADRAAALTRQLLAFGRLTPAGAGSIDCVPMLRSAVTLLERLLPENIHMVFDPKVSSAVVCGDQAQLEQVVLNLVVNARDAMPLGGALRIELDRVPAGEEGTGALVRITITDEGEGIPKPHRERIFEPFYTTKGVGRGTGLGLAVVYGIVRSHGGTVRVEDAAPRGARFIVEIPEHDGPPTRVEVPSDGEAPLGHGEHILLVEDDSMVRIAVREMLSASGYDVTVASNGAAAVASFGDPHTHFDLVILDVVMPVMGGREAYERIRALAPDVRVVFATGYSEEQIDVGFVRRERVPVLTKPYERDALLRTIRSALETRSRFAERAERFEA